MKLIVGLGNPGPKYKNTRHNFGAKFVDYMGKHYGAEFHEKKRVIAEVASFDLDDEKIILAKPLTFMNLSGNAVHKLMAFYKIKINDVLVVHDDLDLPLGVIRIKKGGGNAGHHGLDSISSLCGNDYWRLRLGIGEAADASRFVLTSFGDEERVAVKRVLELGVKYLEKALIQGLENITLK